MERYEFSEILVNYHLNEVCNYNCRYCFSKWEIPEKLKREQDITARLAVLKELQRFFYRTDNNNPMRELMSWNKVRINFSGGEPMLIHKIDEIIKEAHQLGFKPSLVTNGSLLNTNNLLKLAPYLVKLGISLDSPNLETLQKIGRMTKSGKTYSTQSILASVKRAREINSNIIIKINTIVNVLNKDEDFSSLIDSIQPDEWSAIQVLDFFDKDSAISIEEFNRFIDFHRQRYPHLLFSENNEDYSASFLMISPENNFFSNRGQFEGKGYKHSEPIHIVGAEKALAQIDFDYAKYIQRHKGKHILYDLPIAHGYT
ncbi:molybdenum cofactor biosynthesis protein A [Legionella santicrucis]|uniref:S-adenosylmethionine-dependent nucleotide dehydratase n=1 Tax=Legionella santicrucis TaxID=45074 RepID=A0A0W0YSM5_9GAMM|nr:viperin family antiviral radical SAM protein [Legionella santicrucis]KTD59884.1 molybdenum cofactor biosynthesis protein A [Legionella santicrucis]